MLPYFGYSSFPLQDDDSCFGALEAAHLSAGNGRLGMGQVGPLHGYSRTSDISARPFPIMPLLDSSTRDRASSFGSQNGSRRRTYRATLSNGDDYEESHEHALKNGVGHNHRMLNPKRQKVKARRSSMVLDE